MLKTKKNKKVNTEHKSRHKDKKFDVFKSGMLHDEF